MMFILICECGCVYFDYMEEKFICRDCNNELHENEAGKHLIELRLEEDIKYGLEIIKE